MAEDINKQEELAAEALRFKKEGRELSQKHLDVLEKINKKQKRSRDDQEKLNAAKVKANQLTKGQADLLDKIRSLEEKRTAELKKGSEASADRLATLQKTLKLTEDLSDAVSNAATQGKLFADKIAGIDSSFSRAAVASWKAEGNLKGLSDASVAWANNLNKGLSVSKMLFSGLELFYETTVEAVKALDAAGASFVQNTGASRDFATAAFKTRDSLGLMGISAQKPLKQWGTFMQA